MQSKSCGYRVASAVVAVALCAAACGAPEEDQTAAIDLIVEHEGLRLESYQGPSGKWLIGYGHSIEASPGMTITAERAEELLSQDLQVVTDKVREIVRVPLGQNELNALVSLSYSIGEGNFATSSVLRKLNEDDRAGAAEAFLMWVKINDEVSEHLEGRRAKERDLFLTPS